MKTNESPYRHNDGVNQTPKPQHTPTPWEGSVFADNLYRIRNKDRFLIGGTYKSNDRDFIIRAVNSHDELVEALEKIGCELEHSDNRLIMLERIKLIASNALKKAEG